MGLDMYLYRKQHADGENKEAIRVDVDGVPLSFVPDNTTEVKETIGYWCKANQIHHWFVENVQGGEDDQKEHIVTRDQLAKLQEIVDEVLKSIELVPGTMSVGQGQSGEGFDGTRYGFVVENPTIAKRLLPVQEGFFFGSYLYDSWYFEGLTVTKRNLDIALDSYIDVTFSYQADW